MSLQALSWLSVGKGWVCTEQGCWGVQRQLGVCWGALCRVGEVDLPCPELWREAELALPHAQWPVPCTGFLGSASQPAELCAWSTQGRVRDLHCPGPTQALHNLAAPSSSIQASIQSCFQMFMSSVNREQWPGRQKHHDHHLPSVVRKSHTEQRSKQVAGN